MVELEISLVKAFGWSLYEIDHTDIETLIPFINQFVGSEIHPVTKKKVYCDQVSWL
jgi:hypothetical protein